jgi:hypothetical protein
VEIETDPPLPGLKLAKMKEEKSWAILADISKEIELKGRLRNIDADLSGQAEDAGGLITDDSFGRGRKAEPAKTLHPCAGKHKSGNHLSSFAVALTIEFSLTITSEVQSLKPSLTNWWWHGRGT